MTRLYVIKYYHISLFGLWISYLNLDVAGNIVEKIYLGYNPNNHSTFFNSITCICWEETHFMLIKFD